MNLNLRPDRHTPPPAAFMNRRFYYLDSQTRKGLDDLLQRSVSGPASTSLWTELCRALPVERQQPESMRRRVEGLTYASDRLWDEALRVGNKVIGPTFDRERLRRSIRSLPIGHYHYLMGSREPREMLLTRRDGLHDPGVALAKLQHDIPEMSEFICKFNDPLSDSASAPSPNQ